MFYLIAQLLFAKKDLGVSAYNSCSGRFPRSKCLAKSGCHWKQNTCYGYYRNSGDDLDEGISPILASDDKPVKGRDNFRPRSDPCDVINTEISKLSARKSINIQRILPHLYKKCDQTPQCHWNNHTSRCESTLFTHGPNNEH